MQIDYADGTSLGPKEFAGILVIGGVAGAAIFIAKEKVSDWRLERYIKKQDRKFHAALKA